MLATREDVIECYQVILGREPESEAAVNLHLSKKFTRRELTERFLGSDEFQVLIAGRKHLAINKCYARPYLAVDLPDSAAISCFLKHYTFLDATLDSAKLRALLLDKLDLYSEQIDERTYSVTVYASKQPVNEGELTLQLAVDGRPFYLLSFTFAPGNIFGQPEGMVILVSRMQGLPGTKEDVRRSSKDLFYVDPQSFLLCMLLGIAETSGVNKLISVTTKNHIHFASAPPSVMEASYDKFLQTDGWILSPEGYYILQLPIERKSLSEIAAAHRLRTKKKRQFKTKIAEIARENWLAHHKQREDPKITSPHNDQGQRASVVRQGFTAILRGLRVSWARGR